MADSTASADQAAIDLAAEKKKKIIKYVVIVLLVVAGIWLAKKFKVF